MKPEDIKIAWVMNAYQNPDQIIHIIDRILGPLDSVWLHFDKKSSDVEFQYLCNHYKSNPRVHLYKKYAIFWGGIQIVWADLFLAKKLLESATPFDYVIHTTGTTYPVKSDSALRRFLADNYTTSFIRLDPHEAVSATGSTRSRFYAKEHFGIYPGRNIPKYDFFNRVRYKINLKFLRMLSKLGFIKSDFYIPKAYPIMYRGFVHNLIHKDHYLGVLNDRNITRFLAELKYTSCPDEVFFNTALSNLVPEHQLVKDNNLLITFWRKGSASPDKINDDDIDGLINGPGFFARKCVSLPLMKKIDELVDGKAID